MSTKSFIKPIIGQGGIEYFRTNYGSASIKTFEVIAIYKSGKTIIIEYDLKQGAMSGEKLELTWRNDGTWRPKGKTKEETRSYSWYIKGRDYLSKQEDDNDPH